MEEEAPARTWVSAEGLGQLLGAGGGVLEREHDLVEALGCGRGGSISRPPTSMLQTHHRGLFQGSFSERAISSKPSAADPLT